MTGRDLLDQARESFGAHRLRAMLSALGIVCGIAAVVAAFAFAEGARRQAIADLGALGLNNVYVRAQAPAPDPRARRAPAVPALMRADAVAVAGRVGAVDMTAAARAAAVELRAGARADAALLVGVSEQWREVAGAAVARGRWFGAADHASRRRVAVLGAVSARALFGGGDPIGAYVRAGDAWFRVIGVLPETAGQGSARALDAARAAFVPIGAMDAPRGPGDSRHHAGEIVFRVRDDADVIHAARAIEDALTERHRGGDAFRVIVPRALLDARLRARRAMHALLIGVGGLALLIGGVGIMNIMLASVAERTQEIGIRRAFGATRRQIVRQFAVEAALLCVAGGVAGVPAGAALAWGVAALGGWPVAISGSSIVIAIALAASVGLGFGIYPARRAAALDPAEALRAD